MRPPTMTASLTLKPISGTPLWEIWGQAQNVWSQMKSIGYDITSLTVHVEFQNKTHQVWPVSITSYDEFCGNLPNGVPIP